MASKGHYIHATATAVTGVFQALERISDTENVAVDPHGAANRIGYKILITGGAATVEIRGGASGSRAAGEMQVLRTATASELNAIVIPQPEFDFNVTANAGAVTLHSWSMD